MANELVTQSNLSREQIDLIKSTVAVGATDNELKLFLYTAAKRGLDPLLKQIYFIKRNRWNKETGQTESVGTIQTGIDGFRLISDRTKKLSGIKRGVIREGGKLVGAWAEVYRSDWKEPARVEVSFNEYKQVNKNGELIGLWATMSENQLQKCAEAAAHRMAFPEDLSGIYTDDEMGQAESPEPAKISTVAETRRALAAKVNENLKKQPDADFSEGNVHDTFFTKAATEIYVKNKQAETNVKPSESQQAAQQVALPVAEVHSTMPKAEHKAIQNPGEWYKACWEELTPKLSPTPALERAKLTRTQLALLSPAELEAKFQEMNKQTYQPRYSLSARRNMSLTEGS
jgi:phage recombination protein Bet